MRVVEGSLLCEELKGRLQALRKESLRVMNRRMELQLVERVIWRGEEEEISFEAIPFLEMEYLDLVSLRLGEVLEEGVIVLLCFLDLGDCCYLDVLVMAVGEAVPLYIEGGHSRVDVGTH